MARLRRLATPLIVLGVAAAIAHTARSQARPADGGVLIADAPLYDRLTGWLLGGLYRGIADDIAATAVPGARVLDAGCGPGRLVELLAERGFYASGIDLDPAMIRRARARLAGRAAVAVADVAALPFADGSFELVVSTLSMHHWADHRAGLGEIGRVLAPGGRALVYDLHGHVPLHGRIDGPGDHLEGSALELVRESGWRWPGPVALLRRVEARPALLEWRPQQESNLRPTA